MFMNESKIAIVGMSCILAKANNYVEFWNNLINKKECITFFNNNTHNEDSMQSIVEARGIIENLDEITIKGLDNKYIQFMDPQLKLLFQLVEDARLDYKDTQKKENNEITGVFCSSASSFEWRKNIILPKEFDNSYDRNNITYISDNQYYSSQIAYYYNFTGTCATINAACTSSMAALHIAISALLLGEIDCAYVGGVNVNYPLNKGYEYDSRIMFSKDGHCRAFDQRANGSVPGDGGGVLVLKRLEDAIENNDKIYAVIASSAMNNDGNRKMGFAVPSVKGLYEVMTEALDIANVKTEDFSFVEAHGTGTYYGDSLEVNVLKEVFRTNKRNYCALGSVKPNVGYLDVASGIISIIKSILSIHNKIYPPNINFEIINENIDICNSPFFVNVEKVNLNKEKIICGINSFGDGGNNVYIILENHIKE